MRRRVEADSLLTRWNALAVCIGLVSPFAMFWGARALGWLVEASLE